MNGRGSHIWMLTRDTRDECIHLPEIEKSMERIFREMNAFFY